MPALRGAVDVPIGLASAPAGTAVAAVGARAEIVAIGHPFVIDPDAETLLNDLVERSAARLRRDTMCDPREMLR